MQVDGRVHPAGLRSGCVPSVTVAVLSCHRGCSRPAPVPRLLGQGQFLQLDVAGRGLAVDLGDHVTLPQARSRGRTGRRRSARQQFPDHERCCGRYP
jgi:hypothetical protein